MTVQTTLDMRETFRSQGYVSPVSVMSPADAARYFRVIEDFEHESGQAAAKVIRGKGHLKMMALYELVHHPAVLDAVEKVIGPNILCWNSSLFLKEPGDPSYVAWHQDVYDFDTHADQVVTAWIALLPSTHENGALQVVPGSHHNRLAPHTQTAAGKPTLLRDNLELAVEVDPADVFEITLGQGQMSMHHMYIYHGSAPNRSSVRRCGFAVRYVAPEVCPEGAPFAATVVRGTDPIGRFAKDPVPTRDFDPGIVDYVDRFGKPRM